MTGEAKNVFQSENSSESFVIYIILGMAAVTPMDVPLISPGLPRLQSVFGVSPTEAGLVITVFALPGIVFAPVVGVLADKFGRRRIIVPCLILYGLGGLAIALVNQFWMILLLRFVQGLVGGSILMSLAMILVGDFYSGTERNRIMGKATGGLLFGSATYPLIGGTLSSYSWRAPFILYSISMLVGTLAFFKLDDRTRQDESPVNLGHVRTGMTHAFSGKGIILLVLTFVSFVLIFGGILTGVTFSLSNDYGFGSAQIGLIITAALYFAAIVSLLNGKLSTYTTNYGLITLGVGLYGAGFLLIGTFNQFTMVFLGLVVFATGHGLIVPSVSTELTTVGPEQYRGTVISFRTTMVLSSQAAGPLLFTVPLAYVDDSAIFLVTGVVLVILTVVVGRYLEIIIG